MSEPRLSRRQLLTGVAGVAGGAALAAACGPSTPPKSNNDNNGSNAGKLKLTMLVFLGGELGTMPKEFVKEYEAAHPSVKIEIFEQSNTNGYAQMLAQKKYSPTEPLVNLGFFNAPTSVQGIGDDMWARLDYAAMSNAPDIDPRFRSEDGFGIGIGSDQFGLLYNHEKIDLVPTSWSDLWSPDYAGRLCFFENPWYAVFMAAKLNGGGLTDMEPGWDLWERNARQIKLMASSNPQFMHVLGGGKAPLTAFFAGTGQQWIDSGAPLTYVVPSEGAIPLPVYLQAVAGSTQSELEVVHDMINEMISPKWCERWAEASVETPANRKAKLPPKLAGLVAFDPATAANFVDVDYTIVGRNFAEWSQRWQDDVVPHI